MSCLSIALSFFSAVLAHGQGTLTFDWPWVEGGISRVVSWPEGQMLFQVNPRPPAAQDGIAHVGALTPGYPGNGTPKIAFLRTPGNPDYVSFTQINGLQFGLLWVDLADPSAPSLTPVDITFNGFRADGSTVSQTFTVGGGGLSAFQTYQFNVDFALGLTRVEIPSAAWAMDNLVWIPEPSAMNLFLVGVGALAFRQCRRMATAT